MNGRDLRGSIVGHNGLSRRSNRPPRRREQLRVAQRPGSPAMPELHDAQALASAAKEGAEHLEHLREAGMLGVARAVTARAEPLGEAPPPEGTKRERQQ